MSRVKVFFLDSRSHVRDGEEEGRGKAGEHHGSEDNASNYYNKISMKLYPNGVML